MALVLFCISQLNHWQTPPALCWDATVWETPGPFPESQALHSRAVFFLQLVLLRFFCSPQFTVTKRQPISLSAVTIPQALSRKSLWQMLEIWRKKRVYYPLSFDVFNISTFKSCLKCLNPTNFPPVSCSSQACVSGSISKLPGIWCKEIRELVRKQFNQSITTLWWTAVWQMT